MECIGNTGNRLIVDIDRRKPTVQLQRVLDLLDLLGLETGSAPENRSGKGFAGRLAMEVKSITRHTAARLHGSNIELQGPGNHLR